MEITDTMIREAETLGSDGDSARERLFALLDARHAQIIFRKLSKTPLAEGARELVPDLVAETRLAILQELLSGQSFEPGKADDELVMRFCGWAAQIARHLTGTKLRQAARSNRLARTAAEGSPRTFGLRQVTPPSAAIRKEESRRHLLREMDALPLDVADAVRQRYVNDVPIDRIAEIQSESTANVQKRLQRARNRLRKTLPPHSPEGPGKRTDRTE